MDNKRERPSAPGERDTGGNELGIMGASLQIPLVGPTSLSPFKEALCVAAIWLFIAGIPLSFFYNILLWPFVSGGEIFLRGWLRKKYSIAFLPRRFLNWLYATRVWDMFVLRSEGNPKAKSLKDRAMVCFYLGILFFYIPHISSSAAVDLDEMRKVTGSIESFQVITARYSCGDSLTLRLEDGRIESFWCYTSEEDYLSRIKGQEVTVWLKHNRDAVNPACRKRERVGQIIHESHVVGLPYSKERHETINRVLMNISKVFFCLGLFCYLRLWQINRRIRAK
ncbi:MAG: hypothetical protein NTW42_06065 [Deltaproteobacteria bacterium]|nr:hypothetical protein [Deltaproteobacteria bacterium]